MSWSWFWFIVAAILFISEFKFGFRYQKRQKLFEGALLSLSAIIRESPISSQESAMKHLTNLEYILEASDYNSFMQELCKMYGLTYKTENDIRNGRIDEGLKKELATQLSVTFDESKKYLDTAKRESNLSDTEL